MIFNNLEIIFFKLALAFCALSTAGYLLSLIVKKVALARISTWVLTLAFGFLTLNLLAAAFNSPGFAVLGSRNFLSFFAWTMIGIYLLCQFKTKTRVLGAFLSPLILLMMLAAAGQEAGKSLVPSDLQHSLTTLHLILAIIGEALFILASCAGAMFVIQNALLKHKKLGAMARLLPSLGDLDRINHFGLLCGFPLLTIGIISGVVFAGTAWRPGWPADPKIIWSLAAWIAYGVLLHQRLAIGWKGYRMAALSCVAFILLLMSYLAVIFYFTTLHDFI